jgi:hypothetical protein
MMSRAGGKRGTPIGHAPKGVGATGGMQATRPRRPGRRRLEMDLPVGTRFRLFGHSMSERTYEVAGYRLDDQYLLADHPGARIMLRHAGTFHFPIGYGEARHSVERWVLRELNRGGWPWPPHRP